MHYPLDIIPRAPFSKYQGNNLEQERVEQERVPFKLAGGFVRVGERKDVPSSLSDANGWNHTLGSP